MGQERVDSIFDIPSLQEEFGQLVTILQQSKAGIIDLNAQRINLGSANISSFTQATNDLTQATNASTAATAKATTTAQAFTKSQLEARIVNQQRTAALKDEITLQNAAVGSYNALQIQLKQLTAQYKAMGEAERNSQAGIDLSKKVTDTNAQLKIFDASLGNYQRNVGNYNSSLGQLSKGIKGLGGLGILLSNALGIDPSVALGVQEFGRAIRDLQHTQELSETGLTAEAKQYEISTNKIVANAAALDGDTASTEGNIAAKDTASVSNVALAESAEVATVGEASLATGATTAAVALDAEAVSAGAAATATKGFSTALIGTGIGAALIAVIAAIAKIVEVVKDYNAGLNSQVAATELLIGFIGELSSATENYDKVRTAAVQAEVKDLAQLISVRKAAGVTAMESLALDKQLAEAELKNANDEATARNVSDKTLAESRKFAKKATEDLVTEEQFKQEFLQKTSAAKDKYYARDIKAFDDQIANYKKEADAAKTTLDFVTGIFQAQVDAKNKIDLLDTQTVKLNADERRALILAEATTEADITTSKNAIIIADDRSSQAQRLAALRSNLAAQLSVITANLNNVLTDPTKSATDKKIASDKANADSIKDTRTYNEAVYNLNEKYRNEELKAETDFENTRFTAQKDAGNRLLTDRFQDLDANTAIIQKGADSEQKILDNNFALTFLTTHLSTEQLLALREKYEADSVKVTEDANDKIEKLNQKAVDDQVESLKYLQDQRIKYRTDTSNDKNDSKVTGIIDKEQPKINKSGGEQRVFLEEKLNADITAADDKGKLERLKINADEIQTRLIESQAGGETNIVQTESINAELTQNSRDQAEAQRKIDDDAAKYSKEVRDQRLDILDKYIQESLSLIQSFGDAQINAEEDLLKRQQTLQDRRDKMQENAINNSTVSAEQKSAALAAIQKKEEVDQIARDKRLALLEYKKAIFDKQIAEVQTLAQIAIDIAKQDYVGAGLATIALAKLASTYIPLPQYRTGRGEGRDEMAIVHPGEFINRGGQIEATPQVESLTHLMAKDKVYRNKNEMMRDIAFNSLSNYSVGRDGSIEDTKLTEIKEAIYATGRMTSQALKKQKGGNVFINLDGNWKNYISKRVKK